MTPRPTTYVAVNLEAIRHNARQVLARLAPECRLCAVVKGNAYGHGAAAVAAACVAAGARWLAVSTVAEGVALRAAGLTVPILVFMPPLPDEMPALVEHDLTATLTRSGQVMELQREGRRQSRVAQAMIYEDLGLGRLGPHEPVLDILAVAEPWPEIEVTGLYSHFGPPGSGIDLDAVEWLSAGASLKLYRAALSEALARITDRRLLFHVAASALLLENDQTHCDMVRIGTLLFGQYPDHTPPGQRTLALQDTFELRSRIVEVHEVARGARIGYGGEFVCRRPTRVATVPVGVAHGLGVVPESVAGRWRFGVKALLRGWHARRGGDRYQLMAQIGDTAVPLIGRISMDQCCVDVTDVPQADRGSELVLPARRLTTSPTLPRVYEDLTSG